MHAQIEIKGERRNTRLPLLRLIIVIVIRSLGIGLGMLIPGCALLMQCNSGVFKPPYSSPADREKRGPNEWSRANTRTVMRVRHVGAFEDFERFLERLEIFRSD